MEQGGSAQRTLKLGSDTAIVAALYSAPGYRKFEALCSECGEKDGEVGPLAGYDATNWVSDEEDETKTKGDD